MRSRSANGSASPRLDLSIRSSLGEDFLVDLPAEAEISSLLRRAEKRSPSAKTGPNSISRCNPANSPSRWDGKSTPRSAFSRLPSRSSCPSPVRISRPTIASPTTGGSSGPHGPCAARCEILEHPGLRIDRGLGAGSNFDTLRCDPSNGCLLAIGLTQVPLPAALAVVGWLFFLAWRGRHSFLLPSAHGVSTCFSSCSSLLTAGALAIFVAVVAAGLLGSPEMFILGNGSHRTAASLVSSAMRGGACPRLVVLRSPSGGTGFLMLAWALWLAASLIRWLRWAWHQFSGGGYFRKMGKKALTPPPLPTQG